MVDPPPPECTLSEYGNRNRNFAELAIHNPPITVNKFEVSHALYRELKEIHFSGKHNKDANKHLTNFFELCETMKVDGCSEEAVFVRKRQEISSYKQKEGESLRDTYRRFKRLLVGCPNHAYEDTAQMQIFCNGLRPNTRTMLDATTGGSLNYKTALEARKIIEIMASNEKRMLYDRGGGSTSGILELNVMDVGLAQEKVLSKKIDVISVEIKKGIATLNMQPKWPLSGKVSEIVPPKATKSWSTSTSTHSEETVTLTSVEEHIALEKEEEPMVQKKKVLPKSEICLPFPQRLRKEETKKQLGKFLDNFKKLQINIPFAEALEQMSAYIKFMKEILLKKRKIGSETMMLTEECSVILKRKLPPKLKDPGSFSIPCAIGDRTFGKLVYGLGASVSLMPLSIYKSLGIGRFKDTVDVTVCRSFMKHPYGMVEDMLVKGILNSIAGGDGELNFTFDKKQGLREKKGGKRLLGGRLGGVKKDDLRGRTKELSKYSP
ncbi:uncharacterized protein [Cicer arietinum]|uniref:uncharacterized protein n=1 Tax=Cicer arietinum TaxID=3827 RepID=UPI003CC6C47B